MWAGAGGEDEAQKVRKLGFQKSWDFRILLL